MAPVPAPPPRTAPGIPGAAPPAAAPRGPAAAGTSTPLGPAGPATPVPGAAAANGGASGQETQSIAAVDPGAPSTPTARGVPTPPYSPSVPPAVPSGAAAPPIAASPPFVDRAVAARQGSPLASRRDPGVEVWPPVDEESGGRPSGRTIATVFGTVTAVLLVALLASQLFGGPDADPVRTTSAPAASPSTDNEFVAPSGGSADAATPPVNPGDYAVYVLNGTQQNGIAAEVAKTLEADGYRSAGNAGNAANNTVTTTEVFYAEGKKPGAAAVAKTLEVDPANVKKLTRDIEVQGEGADVIVQIGADKATP